MLFPLVLLPSVCIRDKSFRIRQIIFFVLHIYIYPVVRVFAATADGFYIPGSNPTENF